LMRRFNSMGERLRTQQEELGRLERLTAWRQTARFLAHEIKNPLTPIQLAAEQMRDAYRGDDEKYRELVRESAAIIQEEVLGMRNLVSEFSQFARLPEIRAAQVGADDLSRELLALYGSAQLAVSGATGVTLWCDRDQVKRVLVNLIDNALAAQRSVSFAGPAELSFAALPGGGARVRVRDHGPGVPDDRKRRVFEPDFTTKSDGMGLGLAIVEHIVRHHGGEISLHDAPEPGAVFEITLPEQSPAGGEQA
ncbi:MAG: histidine kinase, partial [Candidatus Eisenbacteria bacterium]|nr:histidine kinase [Candidatus Eisenbacteria bacterium]